MLNCGKVIHQSSVIIINKFTLIKQEGNDEMMGELY